jgi:hypothetical protein
MGDPMAATIEPESLDNSVAGRRVPGVAQDHTANVEKERTQLGHLTTSLEGNPVETANPYSRSELTAELGTREPFGATAGLTHVITVN